MAISMVRKPSETPNITNIDDIIPFRYAYGNQSGYVISRGAEVSHTVNGNQFTVNSGRLVIQGVESDIDANGITLTIDSVSETRYYAVYHEINLATNTSNIKVEFDTATYPNITEGDDLTANSSGTARLVLYNFIAQNGVISGVNKVVKPIKYSLFFNVDDSGVFKIGDVIIPQKKIIWEGSKEIDDSAGETVVEGLGSLKNRTFEFIIKAGSFSPISFKARADGQGYVRGNDVIDFSFNPEGSVPYYRALIVKFNGGNGVLTAGAYWETLKLKTNTSEVNSQAITVYKIYEIIE